MHTQRAQYLPSGRVRAVALLWAVPIVAAQAQNSPFMTGATALQTNILAWLTPIAMHLKMEQRGLSSSLAERLREEYRERIARRLARAETLDKSAAPAAEQAAQGTQAVVSAETHDVREIRRQAREAWLQLRSGEQSRIAPRSLEQTRGGEREAPELDTAVSRSAQDDLAL
jgi:hypothetical protein